MPPVKKKHTLKRKLLPEDVKMLQLLKYAVDVKGLAYKDVCKAIGFGQKNIYNIETGHQSFNKTHIKLLCRLTGANANWLFDLEKNMFRKEVTNELSAVELLKTALLKLEKGK